MLYSCTAIYSKYDLYHPPENKLAFLNVCVVFCLFVCVFLKRKSQKCIFMFLKEIPSSVVYTIFS